MKDKILEIINNHSHIHNGMFVITGGKGKLADDLEELFNNSSQLEPLVILQGELLPCPFCGKMPEQYTVGARPHFNEKGTEYVRCQNPKCAIWNDAMMLIKWNKRAGREPQSK